MNLITSPQIHENTIAILINIRKNDLVDMNLQLLVKSNKQLLKDKSKMLLNRYLSMPFYKIRYPGSYLPKRFYTREKVKIETNIPEGADEKMQLVFHILHIRESGIMLLRRVLDGGLSLMRYEQQLEHSAASLKELEGLAQTAEDASLPVGTQDDYQKSLEKRARYLLETTTPAYLERLQKR